MLRVYLAFCIHLLPDKDCWCNMKSKQTVRTSLDIEEYARFLPQYYSDSIPETLRKYLETRSFVSLLDAGCGDGSLLFALKRHGYFQNRTIYAVDLSQNRIRLVRKIDPHIRAYVDDAVCLNTISNNTIDFYISTYVIEHVDDKKMIETVSRVTKRGSTIYISTIFKKWYGWYYYRKDGKWVMDITHLREYSRDEELLQYVDKNEFRIMENRKNQLYFPVIDFIVRRLFLKNRRIFIQHPIFSLLRNIKVPIPGYYEWEIVLERK